MNIADSSKASENYARTPDEVANSPVPQEPVLTQNVRRFRPRSLPTLAAALLLALFISAGLWQWNKAIVKGNLQEQLDARGTEPAVQISTTRVDSESLRYRKIVARGHFESEYQILVDNRILHGQAGYHVITPLRVEGSDLRLLINRGWIPANSAHRDVPQVMTPTGMVQISGTAVVPSAHFFTLGEDRFNPTAEWQSVWQNLDLDRYAKSVDFEIQPVVVELDPENMAGGFAREWRRPDPRRGSHLGYAFQWWGMAAITAVLWLVLNFRRNT